MASAVVRSTRAQLVHAIECEMLTARVPHRCVGSLSPQVFLAIVNRQETVHTQE
jgi:hypothetical protein